MKWNLDRLEGTRLYLRLMVFEDTDLILRWRSRPDVASQLFSQRPPTRAEHEAWFSRLQESDDRIEFVIVVRETQSPIGTIGLSHMDREKREAEYGIMLGEPEWRGQGLAREASDLLLDYAFESLGLQRVRLNLFADNSSARTLYERLGFLEETSLAGEALKDGVLRKTTAMVVTRPLWEKSRSCSHPR